MRQRDTEGGNRHGGITDSRDRQMQREKERMRASVFFAPGMFVSSVLDMKLRTNHS